MIRRILNLGYVRRAYNVEASRSEPAFSKIETCLTQSLSGPISPEILRVKPTSMVGSQLSRTFSVGKKDGKEAIVRQVQSELAQYVRSGGASVRFFQLLFSPNENYKEENGELRQKIHQTVDRVFLKDFVLRTVEANVQMDPKEAGPFYFSQANFYFFLNDLEKAKSSYERAFDFLVKTKGTTDPNVALALASRASILYQEGDYEKALQLYEEAKQIESQCFGESHVLVAQTHHNIALTLLNLNRTVQARTVMNKAIELKRKLNTSPNADLAASLSGLGAILKAEDKLDLAMLAFEECLKTHRECKGDQLEIAENLIEIGAIQKYQGNVEDALENLKEAAELMRANTDSSLDYQLVPVLEMIGECARDLDEKQQAIDAFMEGAKVVDSNQEIFAESHQLASRLRLSALMLKMDDQPLETTQQELDQLVSELRRDSSIQSQLALALALHTQGAAFLNQGSREKSMRSFEESLKLRKQHLGSEHELVGDSLTDMGYVLSAMERFAEAETCLRDAIQIYLRCFQDDYQQNAKLALAYFHLANACYMLNKQLEAERSFKKALSTTTAALGPDHPQVKSLEKMIKALMPHVL